MGKGGRRQGAKGDAKGKGQGQRQGGKGQQGKGQQPMHPGQPANPNSWAAKVQVAQGPPSQPMPQPQAQPQEPQPQAQPDLAQQLAAAPPQQQKQMLGEKLYPIIEKHSAVLAEQAGKITGMLLDMDVSELLNLYEAPDALHQKVIERSMCSHTTVWQLLSTHPQGSR